MSKHRRSTKRPHRIIPVWRQNPDSKKLAKALLMMAMHLDEKNKTIHKTAKQEGGGNHER